MPLSNSNLLQEVDLECKNQCGLDLLVGDAVHDQETAARADVLVPHHAVLLLASSVEDVLMMGPPNVNTNKKQTNQGSNKYVVIYKFSNTMAEN